jgi:hypothetical protein
MYKITGRIVRIDPMEVKSATLSLRQFVIQTEEEYPQTLLFQTKNERTALLDRVRVGQEITLWFSVKGNEWNDKVIINLNCYKIEGVELPVRGAQTPSTVPQTNQGQASDVSSGPALNEDGLPF